ncbi:MAG TPA: apolipoprotein N-acyltransferase [Acidobacteriaceae bacterium]|jgi:apolipoprotein N-acyltransferase|nr:apolipoprotein N-acyltransferase [Acidobacteriaceae bacterium]
MRQISFRLWLLAAFSGLLQVLPFPIAGPVPHWRSGLVFFVLIPLLAALLGSDRDNRPLNWRQTAALGYLSGVIWYLGSCYWIYPTMHTYGGLAPPVALGILVLFSLYLGLYHALFGLLVGLVRGSRARAAGALVVAPFLWVAVELARARITGFPWDQLGVAAVNNYLLTQLAPFTGCYGLSFIIVLVNAQIAAFFVFRDRGVRLQSLAVGLLLAVFIVLGGWHVHRFMPYTANPQQTAVLLQENLEVGALADGEMALTTVFPTTDAMYAEFERLSLHPTDPFVARRAAGLIGPTQLIVWPESPAPFQSGEPRFERQISALARTAQVPVITDSVALVPDPTSPRGFKEYNSAAFFNADGTDAGRYDKVHLVPWGEYVPYPKLFFFTGDLTQGVGSFDPGTERNVFRTNGHTYGTFICYESVFANEVRQFVLNGAEVLVNISDDGWYGDTGAPWQHLDMVRMRAIENDRWILRSTNTGITTAIDPYGRIRERAPRHVRTAIAVGFNYEDEITFYTRYGDVFAWTCVVITLLLAIFALLRIYQPKDDLEQDRWNAKSSGIWPKAG